MRTEFISVYYLLHRICSINGSYCCYEKENTKVGPLGLSLVCTKNFWIITSVRFPGGCMPVPCFFNPNLCLSIIAPLSASQSSHPLTEPLDPNSFPLAHLSSPETQPKARSQWCPGSPGLQKEARVVEFANFDRVNTPTLVDFKLPKI